MKKKEYLHTGIWILLIGLSLFLILNFYLDGKNQDRITNLEVDKEIEKTQSFEEKEVVYIFNLSELEVFDEHNNLVKEPIIRRIYTYYIMGFTIREFPKILCIELEEDSDVEEIRGRNDALWEIHYGERKPSRYEHCDYMFRYDYIDNDKVDMYIYFDEVFETNRETIKFSLVEEY